MSELEALPRFERVHAFDPRQNQKLGDLARTLRGVPPPTGRPDVATCL